MPQPGYIYLNLEFVFENMKASFIKQMDKVIPGLAGMFYMLLERDLKRVYYDYVQEIKRKLAMSEEEAKDEADLIKKIEEESRKDCEKMAGFKHS